MALNHFCTELDLTAKNLQNCQKKLKPPSTNTKHANSNMTYQFRFRKLTHALLPHYNNHNQAFYSQASWGRLEMKPHEQKKKQGQNRAKKGENNGR
jgi:hypothetical protein